MAIDSKRNVVWFDPERTMLDQIGELTIEGRLDDFSVRNLVHGIISYRSYLFSKSVSENTKRALFWDYFQSIWCLQEFTIKEFCHFSNVSVAMEEVEEWVEGISAPSVELMYHLVNTALTLAANNQISRELQRIKDEVKECYYRR